MRNNITVLVFLLGVLLESCTASYNLIDLTHPQDENALGWPEFKGFKRRVATKGWTEGVNGQWIEAYEFEQNEHLGTHIDAPLHFQKDGRTVDQIPLAELTGPGVVIDMRNKSGHEANSYRLTVSDILEWESEHGQIPEGAVVLLNTGNSIHYHNKTRYYGYPSEEAARKKDISILNWPGLSGAGAVFLRDTRRVNGVGLDAISLDAGGYITQFKNNHPAHRALLPANIWILENVGTNINKLPAAGFFVMAMPYKMKGGSGAPTRLVALIPAEDGKSLDLEKLKYVVKNEGNLAVSVKPILGCLLVLAKAVW